MLLLGLLPAVVFAQAPQDVVRLLRLVDSATNSLPKTTEDLFDKGIAEVQDAAILIGTRNRRTNVSSFCGELASYHMAEFKEEKRDAFIFKPHTEINGATGLMTLAIPNMWFRDSSETLPHRVELLLFVCLGDHHHLKITPLKLKKDRLIKKDGYLLYIHRFTAGTGLQIRSAALILDQKWNNAFLLPRNSFTALVVQTKDVKQRKSFSRICDISKGLNQECCRWPFYQTQKNGRRIKFHRCVGEVGHHIGRHQLPAEYRNERPAAKRRNDKKIHKSTKQSVSGESLQADEGLSKV